LGPGRRRADPAQLERCRLIRGPSDVDSHDRPEWSKSDPGCVHRLTAEGEIHAVEIPKPSEADKAAFRALVPDRPDVVVKPMFGNLGAYVNGNMFMGLFGASIGVKLAEPDREKLLTVDGAGPFGPAERPMGGYVSLPGTWRKPTKRSTEWVERSLDYVAALPPKTPKAARKPKN